MALWCLLCLLQLSLVVAGVFDVRRYGAVGDCQTLDTAAIAAAVAAAHEDYASSGRVAVVLLREGCFRSGQVRLLSGVWLSVRSSARLLASGDAANYPPDQDAWALVFANGSSHIGLVGDLGDLGDRTLPATTGGVLDGDFRAYVDGFDAAQNRYTWHGWPGCTGECRPRLVKFLNSTDITVQGVTMQGSPDWTFHLWGCSRVVVSYLTQFGDERWPNNDGIDIDSSQHVLVTDSSFDTADDGVCIKSTVGFPDTYNLTVRNVSIRSRSGAVKVGSATPVPIHDLLFEDIYIYDSHRGLAIQQRDSGSVYNVLFRNVVVNGTRLWPEGWWGGGEPIYLSNMPRAAGMQGGRMRNITFSNVTAITQNAAVISGISPGIPLQSITLSNVTIKVDRLPGWNYSTHSNPVVPPTLDYEPSSAVHQERVSMAGWQPGVFAEGVESLTLSSVSVSFNNDVWQDYWGKLCFNTSAAGGKVVTSSLSCSPPRAPPAAKESFILM